MFPAGRLAVAVLVVLAGVAPASVAAAAGVDADAGATAVSAGEASAVVLSTPDNNSTRHENPDGTNEEGDLGDVSGWLEQSLAERLEAGAVDISQGQYETARGVLGDEYDDQLGKYVDVAGETASTDDDRVARNLSRAGRQQRNLTSDVAEYREVYREYQEARRNGDEERARRLARRLELLARDVDRTAEELNRTFGNISRGADVDLNEGRQQVQQVEENVTGQQTAVREETFVRTRLSVAVTEQSISFLDPARLRGRLTAANGSAVANRSVALDVAGRTVRTRTNATGAFSVAVRPTTVPVGGQSLTVAYRPRNVSVYLGSASNVTANVSQVAASARIVERTDAAAFGETVTVRGRVAAEDVGARGVPVVVTLGGVVLERTRTRANGTFTVEAALPAAVADGTRQLQVRVPMAGRALAVSNATSEMAVEPTATNLTVRAANVTAGVRVTGRLTAADGTPLADQRVSLLVNGNRTTVRTAEDGSFTTVVSAAGSANVSVAATFERPATNLGPSRAETSLALGDESGTRFPLSSLLAWLLAGAVVVLAGGAAVALRRRDGDGPAPDPTAAETPSLDDAGVGPSAPQEAGAASLSAAEDHLADGAYDAAVGAAYVAARAALAARTDASDDGTHWEFLAALEDDGVDDLDGFRDLTATYEQAAFAPDAVDHESARQAVERAAGLGA